MGEIDKGFQPNPYDVEAQRTPDELPSDDTTELPVKPPEEFVDYPDDESHIIRGEE
jgi:hypothetical protein